MPKTGKVSSKRACGIHFISDEESQLDIIFDKANIAREKRKEP